jgi:hypothetical protein
MLEAETNIDPEGLDRTTGKRLSSQSSQSIASDQKDAPLAKGMMGAKGIEDMVNMGVEPRTLALLAPRSKPTELIDLIRCVQPRNP